jgi:hypothetical protein
MDKCLAHYRWTPRRLVGRAAEEIRTSRLHSETDTNGVVARYSMPERELRESGLVGADRRSDEAGHPGGDRLGSVRRRARAGRPLLTCGKAASGVPIVYGLRHELGRRVHAKPRATIVVRADRDLVQLFADLDRSVWQVRGLLIRGDPGRRSRGRVLGRAGLRQQTNDQRYGKMP